MGESKTTKGKSIEQGEEMARSIKCLLINIIGN